MTGHKDNQRCRNALIIGSGPDARLVSKWPLTQFDAVIVINNAWRATDSWTYLIYPHDFPVSKLPRTLHAEQQLIDETDFVPAQNQYGGFVYAGGTMAFTAAYWTLAELRPRQIAHIGCDMHYPASGDTHFYGTGTPDPLRDDISLTSLEACSARFFCFARSQGCLIWNLSAGPSRLLYPRLCLNELFSESLSQHMPDRTEMQSCLSVERKLNYFVADGRYWQHERRFEKVRLQQLDRAWLKASRLEATPHN